MNPESNDPQLERVRREIRAQAAVLHERPLQMRTPPPLSGGAGRIEHARLDYRIGELTGAHYRAFIEQAFQALLKRAPDAAERDAQIALLAAGATKAEVLGNLRWSPEGRRLGVRVAGLLPRYASAKARRVPVLGYVLDLLINLVGLPQLARHQRASDALLAAGDEAAAAADLALTTRIDDLDGHAALLRQRTDDLHAYAHELSVARDVLTHALCDVDAVLRARIDQLDGVHQTHAARLDELEILRRRLHAMNRWSDALGAAFARIDDVAAERVARQRLAAAGTAQAVVAADATRAARNADWASRLRACLVPRARVLALACDPDWLLQLADSGLDVVNMPVDPFVPDTTLSTRELLTRSADASVDGLTALALPVLVRQFPLPGLLAETRRVLRPGGWALFAFAPEAVAIVGALDGLPQTALAADLLEQALPLAGFIDGARVDSADGTTAVLARKAAD